MPGANVDPNPTIELTVVSQVFASLPVTVYPPVLNMVPFTVSPWHPVHDDVTLASVTVDVGVQDCDTMGVPPVQPAGDDVSTVLVCVLSGKQAPQAEYVNDVQADDVGGISAQACDKTGIPVQPAGDDVSIVLVCELSDWHTPQAE